MNRKTKLPPQSVWSATTRMPEYPRLSRNTQVDVCVIGGGIAGLTTAYLLTRAGRSVAVLEMGELANGMTQVTTAHLATAIDDRYINIERMHGEGGARLAAQSHAAAIDLIEATVQREKIDCDFARLDGYLFTPPEQDDKILEEELAAAHRAGLTGVTLVPRAPIASFNTGPCLRFPNQGQFHPLKYLAALAQAIERAGGHIHNHTHADEIEGPAKATPGTPGGPGAPGRVTVGRHTVTASAIVVATNAPINDRFAIHTKQAPYMTYAIGAVVPRGSITRALYWDTLDAYHYVRLQEIHKGDEVGEHTHPERDFEVLIVGGEDHKSGQAHDTASRHLRLEDWARQRFPMIHEVAFTWAGQVMETIDGLAFIGQNPLDQENVFVVTGDSGMGMTHGTIAGLLLTDLILGKPNPWATLYDPSRKTLRAAGPYARENLNVAAQYADWLTPGEVQSVKEIPRGSGAILRRGLSKFAVYRDQKGKLHERSAACPHLGCIVSWNAAENTWDCPCHGSRFEKSGKALNGPTNSDLAEPK